MSCFVVHARAEGERGNLNYLMFSTGFQAHAKVGAAIRTEALGVPLEGDIRACATFSDDHEPAAESPGQPKVGWPSRDNAGPVSELTGTRNSHHVV